MHINSLASPFGVVFFLCRAEPPLPLEHSSEIWLAGLLKCAFFCGVRCGCRWCTAWKLGGQGARAAGQTPQSMGAKRVEIGWGECLGFVRRAGWAGDAEPAVIGLAQRVGLLDAFRGV